MIIQQLTGSGMTGDGQWTPIICINGQSLNLGMLLCTNNLHWRTIVEFRRAVLFNCVGHCWVAVAAGGLGLVDCCLSIVHCSLFIVHCSLTLVVIVWCCCCCLLYDSSWPLSSWIVVVVLVGIMLFVIVVVSAAAANEMMASLIWLGSGTRNTVTRKETNGHECQRKVSTAVADIRRIYVWLMIEIDPSRLIDRCRFSRMNYWLLNFEILF